MRPGYDAGCAVVAREVDERADRVAGIPHRGHLVAAPIDVQPLLAVPRPQAARPDAQQTAPSAQDLFNCRQHARVQPRGVEDFFIEKSTHDQRAGVVLRRYRQ